MSPEFCWAGLGGIESSRHETTLTTHHVLSWAECLQAPWTVSRPSVLDEGYDGHLLERTASVPAVCAMYSCSRLSRFLAQASDQDHESTSHMSCRFGSNNPCEARLSILAYPWWYYGEAHAARNWVPVPVYQCARCPKGRQSMSPISSYTHITDSWTQMSAAETSAGDHQLPRTHRLVSLPEDIHFELDQLWKLPVYIPSSLPSPALFWSGNRVETCQHCEQTQQKRHPNLRFGNIESKIQHILFIFSHFWQSFKDFWLKDEMTSGASQFATAGTFFDASVVITKHVEPSTTKATYLRVRHHSHVPPPINGYQQERRPSEKFRRLPWRM